jgi:hypothetical protein
MTLTLEEFRKWLVGDLDWWTAAYHTERNATLKSYDLGLMHAYNSVIRKLDEEVLSKLKEAEVGKPE